MARFAVWPANRVGRCRNSAADESVDVIPAAPVSDSFPKFVTAGQVRAAQVKFAPLWQEKRHIAQFPADSRWELVGPHPAYAKASAGECACPPKLRSSEGGLRAMIITG